MAKSVGSMMLKLVVVLSFSGVALGNGFSAFYFVQQWLGSYCTQKGVRCCNPPTGKLTPDFTIYGLWPYNNGNFPYNCGSNNFDEALIKPLQTRLRKSWPTYTCPQIGRKFWVHEWNKHGTCSKSALGELKYFKTALNLKNRINILQALARAGIRPDNNKLYSLKSVKRAIARAFGHHPFIGCNHDAQGNSQIWQVSMCFDTTGTRLIKCPFMPKGRNFCASRVKLPYY
ncbi:ribonuclease 1-like [Silene latifolia]|uniref:ribonuclease 1-like n=1 Tax=Silene latifolia TaxID=37657 RepID=UPI003D773862